MTRLVIFLALMSSVVGCDKKQKQSTQHSEFEKIEAINDKTQRILAYDPAIIEGRVDTMKLVIETLEKANIKSMVDKPELQSAYGLYKSSLVIFEEYISKHDVIMFNAQQYGAEIDALSEKENLDQKTIEELTLKIQQNYLLATELMSKYLGVVRQYYRKKVLVERLYQNLQNLN